MREERSYGFIIVHKAGEEYRYLLVRQLTHWSFPKGHTENNERPIETAKRELFEECGISSFSLVEGIQFVEEYVFLRDGIETKKTNTFFVATVANEEIFPQPIEILECKFVEYNTALLMLTYEGQRDILEKAHNEIVKYEI